MSGAIEPWHVPSRWQVHCGKRWFRRFRRGRFRGTPVEEWLKLLTGSVGTVDVFLHRDLNPSDAYLSSGETIFKVPRA